MISKFLGAVVVGSLILPVPADAGSAVGKTNVGGKDVHYGRTNPGGKWLELWYQPKIETRALVMRGAEALSRVRHPAWGIVPPAYFAPEDSGSPDAVSDAVISRAVEDWHRFFAQSGPIEIGINLPTAVLTDSEAIGRLCKQLPNHAAFEGLIVEVNSAELIRNLDLAMRAARQLRLHKVAIAIDDAGPEWLSLTDVSTSHSSSSRSAESLSPDVPRID